MRTINDIFQPPTYTYHWAANGPSPKEIPSSWTVRKVLLGSMLGLLVVVFLALFLL